MTRLGAAALLAAACFALATPWALRPWLTAADAFPHAQGAAQSMIDADLYLNVWILGWLAHAFVHAPAQLFDGNVYYPARDVIVGSENMFAHLPITVPVLAATGNALAVLKAMAFESFVAAALAMFAFVYYHTRDAAAALVAGAAYAFTPIRVETIPQPQYLGTQYLPLALLGVDLVAAGRTRAGGLLTAAALALQALACVYIGYFTLLTVPGYALVRIAGLDPAKRRAAVRTLALAAAATAVALVPAALPYLRARASGVLPIHDPALIVSFSWLPWQWLTPAGWQKIGIVPPLVLAGALAVRLTHGRGSVATAPPTAALWTLAAIGVVLAAGPYLPLGDTRLPLPYLALYGTIPGFSTIRAPLRFYVVISAALSALAGLALARTHPRVPGVVRALGAGALVAAAVVHAAPAPAPTMPANLGTHAQRVYRWLALRDRREVVLEIPGPLVPGDVTGNLRDARYMVASTIHWHPIVNGYTAYPPPTAEILQALARRLPDPDALQRLVDLVPVQWVIVHRGDQTAWEARAWQAPLPPGLTRVERFGTDDVYRIEARAQHPWAATLLERARTAGPRTLEGTPLAPLAPPCRQGRILEVLPPPVMYALPLPVAVPVRFENTSACPWPAFDVRRDHLVGLTYRWVSPSGVPLPAGPFTRLIADVAPGATVRDTMVIAPPAGEFGTWRCEIALVQTGLTEPIARTVVEVPLQPWPGFTATKTM